MEAVNTNFKVIGLTRLGIKPESAAPEANALTTRPFELCLNDLILSTTALKITKFYVSKATHSILLSGVVWESMFKFLIIQD